MLKNCFPAWLIFIYSDKNNKMIGKDEEERQRKQRAAAGLELGILQLTS